jgi:hypothetical protein
MSIVLTLRYADRPFCATGKLFGKVKKFQRVFSAKHAGLLAKFKWRPSREQVTQSFDILYWCPVVRELKIRNERTIDQGNFSVSPIMLPSMQVGGRALCRIRLCFMTLLVLRFFAQSSGSSNSSEYSKKEKNFIKFQCENDIPSGVRTFKLNRSSAWSEMLFFGTIEQSGCTKLWVRPYWHGVEKEQPYLVYWVKRDDLRVPSGHQVGYKKAPIKPQWYDSMMDVNQGVHLVGNELCASNI